MPRAFLLSLKLPLAFCAFGFLGIASQSCSDRESATGSVNDERDASMGGGGGATEVDAGLGGSPAGGAGGTGGRPPPQDGGGGSSSEAGAPAGEFPGEKIEACPGTALLDVDALGLPTCPLCADAVCLPKTLLGEFSESSDLLADCSDGTSKCVPRSYVATAGSFLYKSCRAFGEAEGRCVNKCVPQVANQVGLEQGTCGDNELCAPCFMPTDGSPTGACGLGCDPGPSEPPYLFDTCCSGEAVCVPSELVPANQAGALGQDTCSEPDQLCVPSEFIDPAYTPPTCTSVAGAEGRCLGQCIPELEGQADFLPQDICDAGKVCAPCYDPLSGESTGACSINGDSPTEPAVVFGSCCNDLGKCVPESSVPAGQRGALDQDVCSGTDMLCAPTKFIDSNFTPLTCRSLLDAEGRCVPACVAGAQATYLPQGVCDVGEVCAPCYDPGTGASTGACSVNGDSPTEPAVLFTTCCEGDGYCVPEVVVPEGQRSALVVDTCAGDAAVPELCVPEANVTGPKPPDCTQPVGGGGYSAGPGVCFNPCTLPDFGFFPQADCPAGRVCIPCFEDDGTPTGACDDTATFPGADAGAPDGGP